MEWQDIKLMAFNGTTLTLSMTEMETILKIVLLGVTIGYTIQKWYLLNKDK